MITRVPPPSPQLQRASVPRCDTGLFEPTTHEPLQLRLPGYNPKTKIEDKRRDLLAHDHITLIHELYPIIPPFLINLDRTRLFEATTETEWVDTWQKAWSEDYLPLFRSGREAVKAFTEVNQPILLGIFGLEIGNVMLIAKHLRANWILFHYMMMVTLQYYLSARNRWFAINSTRPDFPCDDLYPTCTFLMFRGIDWGVEKDTTLPTLDEKDNFDIACKVSFPIFFQAVLLGIRNRVPNFKELFVPYEDDEVGLFCQEKLKKNFSQAMVCCRFREIMPVNLLESINSGLSSPLLEHKHVKFYPHPNHIKLLALSSKRTDVLERIPMMYTHLFFSPVQRVLDVTGPAAPIKRVLLLLLPYLPMVDFVKQALPRLPKPFFPQTLEQKEHEVDPLFEGRISAARLRYTFYVQQDVAYAYMPSVFTLHPPSEDVHNEATVFWSETFRRPLPKGPILFGYDLAELRPGDPLMKLERSVCSLRQTVVKPAVLRDVQDWIASKPSTVTESQYRSLRMLLGIDVDHPLLQQARQLLDECAVIKSEACSSASASSAEHSMDESD